MKRNLLLASMVLAAGSLFAQEPKDEVANAAKKLADTSYAWKQTTENAGGGGGGGFAAFGNAPLDGKAEKSGLTYSTQTFNFQDNETKIERLSKGTNSAMNRGEGWQTSAEMAAAFGGGGGGGGGGGRRGGGGFNAAIVTPAAQAQDIIKQLKEVKMSGGAYVGDLTEEGAKTYASPFGRGGGRRGGGGGGGGGFTPPEITGAKGTVSFWVKDGALSKYVMKVQGKTTDFNGDPQDINRTTTVEIKEVGSAKINVPDDIKKKLE